MLLSSRLKQFLYQCITPGYSWPAIDIWLPGQRYLHLVGSIHMGTQGMSPLPPSLIKRLKRADALVVGFDDPENSVRRQRWPVYKAQRNPKLDALVDGINATGSGMGHDLQLCIDGDPNLTFIKPVLGLSITSEAKRIAKKECCAYSCKSKPNDKKIGLCQTNCLFSTPH